MDELRPITEYINTTLGAAGLAAAAFAANWVRNVVHRYFKYLEIKRKRWLEKAIFAKDQGPPPTEKEIEAIVVRVLKRIAEDRKNARTPTG